jgi:hypothetical protein
MEDAEPDTLVFNQIHDDGPDTGGLPGVEGWEPEPAGDDPLTRRTVRLQARASRTGWYAVAGLLGAIGLAVIVIALPRPSAPVRRPVQSHQRVATQPVQRSPRRSRHHARPGPKPRGQRRLRVVPHHRVIHRRRAVVPVAPASSPAPTVVAGSPAAPAASAPVPERPRVPQRPRGQFSYLGR